MVSEIVDILHLPVIIIQLLKVEYKYHANRAQISCDIVRLLGLLVILCCKKTCLTSRLHALRFSIRFAFPTSIRNEQKDLAEWIINNLLDVLVCSIAEYF